MASIIVIEDFYSDPHYIRERALAMDWIVTGKHRELDSITFSKWRKESIKAYGNAIVPQVAYQIFKAIIETERRMEELL